MTPLHQLLTDMTGLICRDSFENLSEISPVKERSLLKTLSDRQASIAHRCALIEAFVDALHISQNLRRELWGIVYDVIEPTFIRVRALRGIMELTRNRKSLALENETPDGAATSENTISPTAFLELLSLVVYCDPYCTENKDRSIAYEEFFWRLAERNPESAIDALSVLVMSKDECCDTRMLLIRVMSMVVARYIPHYVDALTPVYLNILEDDHESRSLQVFVRTWPAFSDDLGYLPSPSSCLLTALRSMMCSDARDKLWAQFLITSSFSDPHDAIVNEARILCSDLLFRENRAEHKRVMECLLSGELAPRRKSELVLRVLPHYPAETSAQFLSHLSQYGPEKYVNSFLQAFAFHENADFRAHALRINEILLPDEDITRCLLRHGCHLEEGGFSDTRWLEELLYLDKLTTFYRGVQKRFWQKTVEFEDDEVRSVLAEGLIENVETKGFPFETPITMETIDIDSQAINEMRRIADRYRGKQHRLEKKEFRSDIDLHRNVEAFPVDDKDEDALDLLEAVESLHGVEYRLILQLLIEGDTHRSIASRLSCSSKSIQRRMNTIRKTVTELLR